MKGFKGFIISDYGALREMAAQGPEERARASAMMAGAFQHFMNQPMAADKQFQAKIKEFVGKGDFPTQMLDYVDKFVIGEQQIDTAWQQVFDVLNFQGTDKSGFKIRKVSNGLVFAELLNGESVEIQAISGTEITVPFRRFGGGIGYDQVWWDDQDWYMIEDETRAFRNKWYKKLAQIHTALVEALGGGVNQAWNTNLVKTLNDACVQIILDAENVGMDIGDNPTFVLWSPLNKKPAVMDALRAAYLNTATDLNKPLHFNIVPAFTTNFSSNTYAYLCLPKGQLKSGDRMGLQLYGEFDIYKYSTAVTGYFRHGAAIGDSRQIRRIPFSA